MFIVLSLTAFKERQSGGHYPTIQLSQYLFHHPCSILCQIHSTFLLPLPSITAVYKTGVWPFCPALPRSSFRGKGVCYDCCLGLLDAGLPSPSLHVQRVPCCKKPLYKMQIFTQKCAAFSLTAVCFFHRYFL